MRTLNQTELFSIAGGCEECQSVNIDNYAVLSTILKHTGIGAAVGFGISVALSVAARDIKGFPMMAAVFTGVAAQFGAISSLYPVISNPDDYIKQQ